MSTISIPNQFVSGVVSRAADVNANFNVIASGLSNGTKDINVAGVTATSLTATTANIGTLGFTNINATNITANSIVSSGVLAVQNAGGNQAQLRIPNNGTDGTLNVNDIECATFNESLFNVVNFKARGTGLFASNVTLTKNGDFLPDDIYLKVQITGQSTGEVRLTAGGVGTWEADDFRIKTDGVTRVKIDGGNGRMSVGGDFPALSPLHVSGNIRCSGALINGNISVSGFSNLGELSPPIKMAVVSGTMSVNDGAALLLFPNLGTTNVNQILGIQITVLTDIGLVGPHREDADYYYTYRANASELYIINGSASTKIKGKPAKALITYRS